MARCTANNASGKSHVPVLLDACLEAMAPINGVWVDGTFGAGGYSHGLIKAGANRVYAIDCDPEVNAGSTGDDRIILLDGWFADFDRRPELRAALPIDGVVFDLGLSSMQLGSPARGFSFMRDGPLDMRMSGIGRSAADIVNQASEAQLADIIFHFGDEPLARKIAQHIVKRRRKEPITTTGQLAKILLRCRPSWHHRVHPATRCFQALRIAVNNELGQLVRGLEAAERALRAGGWLAVISFHSLEDRIVKQFIRGDDGQNRHVPQSSRCLPSFAELGRQAVRPDPDEVRRNPRARSARLRIARRTDAPSIGDRGSADHLIRLAAEVA